MPNGAVATPRSAALAALPVVASPDMKSASPVWIACSADVVLPATLTTTLFQWIFDGIPVVLVRRYTYVSPAMVCAASST